jgi:hypothetical protein
MTFWKTEINPNHKRENCHAKIDPYVGKELLLNISTPSAVE